MKYKKLTGIVLKKQNYKEADQIITIWSKELGKIRVLAKSLRLSKSKLAYAMQDLALVEVEITGNNLPVLIGAKAMKNYKQLRSNLQKIGAAFYLAELMLKTTADEHPNEQAFDLMVEFLGYLDKNDVSQSSLAIPSFSLKLLGCLGFNTKYAGSSFKIPEQLADPIESLRLARFQDIDEKIQIPAASRIKLSKIVSNLVEFVLERDLKSEPFLQAVN